MQYHDDKDLKARSSESNRGGLFSLFVDAFIYPIKLVLMLVRQTIPSREDLNNVKTELEKIRGELKEPRERKFSLKAKIVLFVLFVVIILILKS